MHGGGGQSTRGCQWKYDASGCRGDRRPMECIILTPSPPVICGGKVVRLGRTKARRPTRACCFIFAPCAILPGTHDKPPLPPFALLIDVLLPSRVLPVVRRFVWGAVCLVSGCGLSFAAGACVAPRNELQRAQRRTEAFGQRDQAHRMDPSSETSPLKGVCPFNHSVYNRVASCSYGCPPLFPTRLCLMQVKAAGV